MKITTALLLFALFGATFAQLTTGTATPANCTIRVDDCRSGPCSCKNGATCVGPNYYTCACLQNGYAGDYCDIPQCSGQNFPNGCTNGYCVAPGKCDCYPGWNGTDCSKPICDPPCAHGPCQGPNTCNCQGTGYTNCVGQPNICGCDENECLRADVNKVCDSLSQCTNTDGNYTCSPCPVGYTGSPYLYYPYGNEGNFTVVVGGCVPAPTDRTSAASSAGAATSAAGSSSAGASSNGVSIDVSITVDSASSALAPFFSFLLAAVLKQMW